nr:MAG TPA: hypothetical protein [Caudoviricetes sp.]
MPHLAVGRRAGFDSRCGSEPHARVAEGFNETASTRPRRSS